MSKMQARIAGKLVAAVDAYSFPSLASSSDNIFRLCVSTIFRRDDFGGQDLRSQRSEQSIELEKYKIQQLGSTRVCCGDSLVREYSTVCPRFSVVEQWISLCLAKTERGWAGEGQYLYMRKLIADLRIQSSPGWIKVDPWKNPLQDRGQVTSNPRQPHYRCCNIITRWHFELPRIVWIRRRMLRPKFSKVRLSFPCSTTR